MIFALTLISFFLVSLDANADCASPVGVAGQIEYIPPELKFCNGTTWTSMKGAAGASCVGTTAGTYRYASSSYDYCDGTTWYSMKGAAGASCVGTTAGTMDYSSSVVRFCDGSSWYSTAAAATTAPTGISFTHTQNTRNIYFSWTGGSGNGGAGGCRLQYLKDGTTWTNVNATTYNCDANVTNTNTFVPASAGWTNNFASGVSIRILRVSDSVALATFPQQMTCIATKGSSTSTPNTDEDCNGNWDNTVTEHGAENPPLTYGTAYNCPATISMTSSAYNGTITGSFLRAYFQKASYFAAFNDLSCTSSFNPNLYYNFSIYLYVNSGTVPNFAQNITGDFYMNDTMSCQVHPNNSSMGARLNSAGTAWDYGECRYTGSYYN